LPGANEGAIVVEAVPEDGRYEVRPGDNLSLIARRFSTTPRRLVQLNELRNGDRIYPGQSLRVVARGEREPRPAGSPDTEPVSQQAEAESTPGEAADEPAASRSVPEEQPELAADPSDYAVSPDGRITLQWAETLGHHAEWLDIRTQRLRDMNDLRFGESVAAGRRLRLDFSEVEPADYEARRLAYHGELQRRFFSRFRIMESRDYTVQAGDSLWRIARRHGNLPEWLIQQYNPDRDLDSLRPGDQLRLPVLEERP
jgi:membrane-bound lytic murein transglycosylase D